MALRHAASNWGGPIPTQEWLYTGVAIGVALFFLILLASFEERDELERQLAVAAYHDHLTQLLNRGGYADQAGQALAACQSARKPATIAVIDIDHFKSINDGWGHSTGDEVLRGVARSADDETTSPQFRVERLAKSKKAALWYVDLRMLREVTDVGSRFLVGGMGTHRVQGLSVEPGTKFRLKQDSMGVPVGAVLIATFDDGSYCPEFKLEDPALWEASTYGEGGREYFEDLGILEEIVQEKAETAAPIEVGDWVSTETDVGNDILANVAYRVTAVDRDCIEFRDSGGDIRHRHASHYTVVPAPVAEPLAVLIPSSYSETGLEPDVALEPDAIYQPAHYARYKIEPITFIMENGLPFAVGNVVKYVLRYDAKDASGSPEGAPLHRHAHRADRARASGHPEGPGGVKDFFGRVITEGAVVAFRCGWSASRHLMQGVVVDFTKKFVTVETRQSGYASKHNFAPDCVILRDHHSWIKDPIPEASHGGRSDPAA